MGNLVDYPTATCTKALLIGDSGTGKTGALLSLAKARYNLRILDFDAGLDILANLAKGDTATLNRIRYITCTDVMRSVAGKVFPVSATAWPKAMDALTDWKDGAEPTLGPVASWGPKDILVIDSLNFAGKAATRLMQQINGRLAVFPIWTDYGDAQKLVESMCAMLFSETIKCNVLVLSHVREVGKKQTRINEKGQVQTYEEEGTRKGYAETGTGSALSPTIGRYFNAVLLADIVGSGQSSRRIIRTVPHENIGLKNPAPGIVKSEYPLATGLAEYFAAVRGESGVAPQVK